MANSPHRSRRDREILSYRCHRVAHRPLFLSAFGGTNERVGRERSRERVVLGWSYSVFEARNSGE